MNELQKKYLGKHLLVGLTYLNEDQEIRERVQFHGNISKISKSIIVFIRADNGEEFSIPFDEENLEPGQHEAVYELNTTGEPVKNVDYLSTWTIHPPREEDDQQTPRWTN